MIVAMPVYEELLRYTTLKQRIGAAAKLVQSGQMDGPLALSYVIWPTSESLPKTTIKIEPPRCTARHGDRRCEAECSPDISLCEEHLWAYLAGEDFDYWGEAA